MLTIKIILGVVLVGALLNVLDVIETVANYCLTYIKQSKITSSED